MAITGTIDVNSTLIGKSINYGLVTAEGVTGGIASVSDLIGIGIGLLVAITAISAALVALFLFVGAIIKAAKGLVDHE
jgi:hypothetical protein